MPRLATGGAEGNDEMEWIRIKDRLPDVKENELFLCAIWSDILNKYVIDTRTYWADAKMFSGVFEITHWMPLPKPPENK